MVRFELAKTPQLTQRQARRTRLIGRDQGEYDDGSLNRKRKQIRRVHLKPP